jgi:hypothetical protein
MGLTREGIEMMKPPLRTHLGKRPFQVARNGRANSKYQSELKDEAGA